MVIPVLFVAWIERVVADHVQRCLRQVRLRDLIQILVVPPRKMDLIESAARRVNAASGLTARIAAVWVVGKEFRENDFLGERAADGKRVTDDTPLWLAEQTQDFAQIVNQSG